MTIKCQVTIDPTLTLNLTCDMIGGIEGGQAAELQLLLSGWADLRTT